MLETLMSGKTSMSRKECDPHLRHLVSGRLLEALLAPPQREVRDHLVFLDLRVDAAEVELVCAEQAPDHQVVVWSAQTTGLFEDPVLGQQAEVRLVALHAAFAPGTDEVSGCLRGGQLVLEEVLLIEELVADRAHDELGSLEGGEVADGAGERKVP